MNEIFFVCFFWWFFLTDFSNRYWKIKKEPFFIAEELTPSFKWLTECLAGWLAELGLRFSADVHVYEMLSGLELSPDRLALLLLHLLGRWQNGRRCQSCLIVATTSGGGVGDGAVLGATDWLHSQCWWQDGWLIPDFLDHVAWNCKVGCFQKNCLFVCVLICDLGDPVKKALAGCLL